jgi:N-acetylglucosaminyldiphosphoundecaprenol N-acetyl-beta-D-mannosaminyltransferase
MKTKLFNILFGALPLLVFTVMLAVLLLIRLLYGMVLPAWGAWGFGLGWCVMAFDYLLRAELFKQIGGFAVTLFAVLILFGALMPQERIAQYPHMVSEQLIGQMESAWNAVYTGNIFEQYSLKQQLINYGTSLGNLDPFRHGKMILFSLLGFALAVCYLFLLEPFRRKRRVDGCQMEVDKEALTTQQRNNSTTGEQSGTAYATRFTLLLLAGAVFAIQVELLQVLSPTRMVTGLSILDSCFGFLIGLLIFVPVHLFYVFLAEHRAKGSRRFNVLGVGVDAVGMSDCLKLFEDIISDRFEVGSLQFGVSDALSTINHQPSTPNRCHRPVMTSAGVVSPNNQYPITNNAHPKPFMTTALGVAGIIEARRSQKLQRILNESVLNTPDGMPLVWLGKLFGYQHIERVYGPDLLRDVCAYSASKGWKHFFYGAAPGIVEKLKEKLEKKNPGIQIVGIYCPPFRPLTPEEESDLVKQVAEAKPDIFWIGISTPKQLYFMDQMRDKLDCKIICPVGYAFDVNAGVQEDAPDWAKYSGFQWLHRAIKQPRLWKRYLPDNPRFVFEVVLQILHLKKYPMFIHERPLKPFTDTEGYSRFPAGVVSLSAMTLAGARDRVLNWVATGQRHYVNVCTADTMVQCFDRPDMAKIVNEAGMATTDGMPLVWLAHHYGFKAATRVYGPDLMLQLCAATSDPQRSDVSGQMSETDRGQMSEERLSDLRPPISEKKCVSHFFYGATDEVLAQLKTNLLKKFPSLQIAGMVSPPFRPLTEAEKEEMSELINASGADIVWCGLGTPKQDYWVAEFRPRLNAFAILAVGAAFNFHAGEVRQSPRWMMRSGLEWLFRLLVEPKRLWRRYLIGNPRFVCLVAGTLFKGLRTKGVMRS